MTPANPSEQQRVWWVVYRVPAITADAEHAAGPYYVDELDDERRDICGFEGVQFVRCEKREEQP